MASSVGALVSAGDIRRRYGSIAINKSAYAIYGYWALDCMIGRIHFHGRLFLVGGLLLLRHGYYITTHFAVTVGIESSHYCTIVGALPIPHEYHSE